jgi:hypothetical protein
MSLHMTRVVTLCASRFQMMTRELAISGIMNMKKIGTTFI